VRNGNIPRGVVAGERRGCLPWVAGGVAVLALGAVVTVGGVRGGGDGEAAPGPISAQEQNDENTEGASIEDGAQEDAPNETTEEQVAEGDEEAESTQETTRSYEQWSDVSDEQRARFLGEVEAGSEEVARYFGIGNDAVIALAARRSAWGENQFSADGRNNFWPIGAGSSAQSVFVVDGVRYHDFNSPTDAFRHLLSLVESKDEDGNARFPKAQAFRDNPKTGDLSPAEQATGLFRALEEDDFWGPTDGWGVEFLETLTSQVLPEVQEIIGRQDQLEARDAEEESATALLEPQVFTGGLDLVGDNQTLSFEGFGSSPADLGDVVLAGVQVSEVMNRRPAGHSGPTQEEVSYLDSSLLEQIQADYEDLRTVEDSPRWQWMVPPLANGEPLAAAGIAGVVGYGRHRKSSQRRYLVDGAPKNRPGNS
jgi:hypothetical protein